MTTWQKIDGKIRKIGGKIVVDDDDCCCCDCENCCESMDNWYNQLLYDITTGCGDSATGLLTQATWEAICGAPVCSMILTCLGDLGNRRASFGLAVHMESSAPCDFTANYTEEGDCWPPDVTFTFDTGANCCGVVTVRFYAPNCPDPCYCRCDNHCMDEFLWLTAIEEENCPSVGTDSVELACDGACSWSGSGSFGGGCSYDFELIGDDSDNCVGDYTLTVKSGGVTIWSGKNICLESVCYPTSLVFGPIELPCCDGGTVKIYATSLAP